MPEHLELRCCAMPKKEADKVRMDDEGYGIVNAGVERGGCSENTNQFCQGLLRRPIFSWLMCDHAASAKRSRL